MTHTHTLHTTLGKSRKDIPNSNKQQNAKVKNYSNQNIYMKFLFQKP